MINQLTVFYDKSCMLCRTEVESLVAIDSDGILKLVDCSAPQFIAEDYNTNGITTKQMLNSLHIQNINGEWFTGVDAFGLMYKVVGLPFIGSFWSGKYTRPLTKRLYPYIAKNRHILSKIGLVQGLELAGKYYAWRASRKSMKCRNGLCKVERKEGGEDHAN